MNVNLETAYEVGLFIMLNGLFKWSRHVLQAPVVKQSIIDSRIFYRLSQYIYCVVRTIPTFGLSFVQNSNKFSLSCSDKNKIKQ